jgi:hypothetical protein
MRLAGSVPLGKAVALGLALVRPSRIFAKESAHISRCDKRRGNWLQRSICRRIGTARGFARDFHNYLAESPVPERAVVIEAVGEIGGQLAEARRHLHALKRERSHQRRYVVSIDEADRQIVLAAQLSGLVESCCLQTARAADQRMESCNALAIQLDKTSLHVDEMERQWAQQRLVGSV